jgi:hypothetical protein
MSAIERRHLWVSVLLLLLMVAGLIRQWPERGLWYDETVNAYFAGRSWSDIWRWCTKIDNQMPLDFALRKVWGEWVGTSEFALRAFSFVNVILAAAGLMALGRRVGGKMSAGWLAALAFALSQSFLYAAFEVRPYALALALFAWSSAWLWDVWRRYAEDTRPLSRGYFCHLGVYWLLALALIYTHYTGLMALAAHGVYVGGRTLAHRSRRRVVILSHLAAGIILGYLPWTLALAGRDVRAGTAYAARINPRVALETYTTFYAYGQTIVPDDTPPYGWIAAGLIVILIAITLLIGVWNYRKDHTRLDGMVFALSLTVIPLLGLLAMVYGVQAKLSGRHGWPVWIGAALLIGVGLAALDRLRWYRWPVWGAALLIVSLPARVDTQPLYNSYLREAFAYIDAHNQPGDVLILRDGTLFTAAVYYGAAVPWIGLPPDQLTDVTRFLFFDEAIASLETLVEGHDARRVWVIAWQGHIMDPQNLVAGILEAIGGPQPLEGASGFGDVSVSLYDLRQYPDSLRDRVARLRPVVQVPPDGPVFYGGYALADGPIPHGGAVQIQTWWQRGVAVVPGLRVSLRLYDPAGDFYAQLDQPPVSASFGQENWLTGSPILSRFTLWVPPEIPSGVADIKMILYDVQGAFETIMVTVDRIEIVD